MATVTRGDTGCIRDAKIIVCTPFPDRAFLDDVAIECSIVDGEAEWGFPVKLTLTRDEALELCSQIAQRLKTPVEEPRPTIDLGRPARLVEN